MSIFNFEYTHKPYDSTIGLYYYGARFYDPSISRFITEDSAQYANTQNPLTLNRYAYVVNNPETLIDSNGHYVNECVNSPNCPSVDSGGGSGGGGSSGSNTGQISGSSGTSTSSSNQWFDNPDLMLGTFLINLAGDVAAIINPALEGIFKSIAQTIQVSGALAGAFGDLVEAIKHNAGGIISAVASFVWTLTTAIILKASGYQKLIIALGSAAAGIGDAEGYGETMSMVGVFQLITDVSFYGVELSQS